MASTLDKDTFRQGIDKLETRQKEQIEQQKKHNEHLEKLSNLADLTTATKLQGAEATTASTSERESAKTAAEGLFPTVPSPPSGPGSGSAPKMGFSLAGKSVSINPFTPERFAAIAAWFKAAMAWLTLVLLGAWVWKALGEWVRGFSTIQQAKGNTVVAGTGGQATSLIAAGIITVIIVTGTTALLGWSYGELSFPAIAGAVATNPYSEMASTLPGAWWLLDQLFPVGVMVTALIARVTFNLYAATVFSGAMAAVRFVVP